MINASASLLQIGSALSVNGVKRLFNFGLGSVVTPGHCADRIIFRSLLSPDFFEPLIYKGKSGDKGERFASTAFFCLLR
ncbi:hypothetical protein M3629_16495 [Paenibacillus polysaccharolyticus]|uniref:hypothetical protein n=1 Tax=Paenibacillus polysaccharolyticus TaxID=582692 RepID=UPI00203D76D2|nr:hypothetical protein [Paenibacillus polysaccharolyticus]MCM3134395.1 hypothetical protein [Paenibacillus polysaccharolyticus]